MLGPMETIFPGLEAAPNIHPLLVHFPIVLWLLAILLYVVGVASDRKKLWTDAAWLLLAGTIAGVLAAMSGYAAADELGHDSPGHDLVHTHRDWMLWALGCASASTVLAITELKRPSRTLRLGVAVCMIVTAAVVTLGADRGALLVFGHGVGISQETEATSGHSDHGQSDHGHSEHGQSEHGQSEHGQSEHGHSDHGEPEPADPSPAAPTPTETAPADPTPASDGHEGHDHSH